MSFIDEYKRVDNFLKDQLSSDTGVSTYIEEMKKILERRYNNTSFLSDYKSLKHYRYIRNKIVHEVGCSESNMCDEEDILWVKTFYLRLMNGEDPLSLHHKEKMTYKKNIKAVNKENKTKDDLRHSKESYKSYKKKKAKRQKILLTIFVSLIALITLFFLSIILKLIEI